MYNFTLKLFYVFHSQPIGYQCRYYVLLHCLYWPAFQSAGGPKEDKKKAKKNKQKLQQQQQKQQGQQQQGKTGGQAGRAHSGKSIPQKGKLTIDDIKVETLAVGDKDGEK